MVGKTKMDGLLSVLDEEDVITTLSVVEVSGPWLVTNNNHFMKDKKKNSQKPRAHHEPNLQYEY
jgi:hypothetical protein